VSPSPSGNLRLQNVHNPSLFLAIRDGMLTSGVGGSHCELFANPHGGNIYSFRAVDGSGAIGVFENGQAKPPFQVGEFVAACGLVALLMVDRGPHAQFQVIYL
jgi:hypothetical protein